MKLRKISLVFLALLVAGFGCKSLSAEEQAAVRPVTLNYWTVFGDTDELKRMADEYKALHPHITVKIRQVRYDEFDSQFVNALADDVQPDIVSVHTRWLRAYQSRLATMPASVNISKIVQTSTITKETQVLTDTFTMPTQEDLKKDWLAAVPEDAIIGNKIYGLPLSVDALGVYYNQDLLDKAGIAEPPQSWDDFVAAVKLITKIDKDGKIVQSGASLGTGGNIDNSFDIVSALIAQNGVTLATPQRAVGFASGIEKTGLTHPTLQALDFYTNFARPTKDVYSWNADQSNAFDAFARGKTGFYIGFAYDYERLKSRAPDLNFGVLPLFQLNKTKPANIANYWLETVVKKSKNQNEAWDFIRFISSPENLKKYSDATKIPSPLRLHLKDEQKDPVLGAFADQLLVAKNWYKGTDIAATEQAFDTMIMTLLKPVDPKLNEKQVLQNQAAAVNRAAAVAAQTMR